MKSNKSFFGKSIAVAAALSATLTIAACGNDDSSDKTSESTSASETAPAVPAPTAAELQEVLLRAVDPEVPTDQKLDTVVGGEEAPEIFDSLTQARQESGAELSVVDPVLPAFTPGNYVATVNLTLPEQEPVVMNDVEFVNQDGHWKLDQRWACTLVQNVLPDQVPEQCHSVLNPDAPAPEAEPVPEEAAAEEEAPAPEEAPAEPAPEEAPAAEEAAPAPAPEEAPAPAPEGE